jgi:hypothetical protein
MHLHYLENVEDRLLIKLAVLPSTVEELALIRFWLLKLSQANFEEFYAYDSVLNPEFLSVLNPRAGPRKILFHANDVEVEEFEPVISADFAQLICARRITLTLYTTPVLESHRNNIFRFITGTGNTLEKCRIWIFYNESNHGEFCEFIFKVIHF